ncbi:hypothetical protein RB597_005803 [Gaeumannomyces tritici]
MQPSYSLAVQALLAALVVTEVAAAPMQVKTCVGDVCKTSYVRPGTKYTPNIKVARDLEHQEEKRANPLYETGVGGKPAPRKPSTVTVGKPKPAAPISTTPKKPITPVVKGKRKREVGHDEAPIVEKRKNPLYETGVGGKPARKPSTVNVGKPKPAAPISATPKKPITPVIKGNGKRDIVDEAAVEKRVNPMYETGIGGKPARKPSTVTVGKPKPAAPISTTPKKPITPVVKGSGKGKREVDA